MLLNTMVTKLTVKDDHIEVQTNTATYTASKVVSTLPPNLLVSTIEISPELPKNLVTTAKKTHTWIFLCYLKCSPQLHKYLDYKIKNSLKIRYSLNTNFKYRFYAAILQS